MEVFIPSITAPLTQHGARNGALSSDVCGRKSAFVPSGKSSRKKRNVDSCRSFEFQPVPQFSVRSEDYARRPSPQQPAVRYNTGYAQTRPQPSPPSSYQESFQPQIQEQPMNSMQEQQTQDSSEDWLSSDNQQQSEAAGKSFMSAANVVNFLGRTGQDPEIKYLESGAAVCKFPLAISNGKNRDPTWIDVEFWNRQAEVLSNYVRKGQMLLVVGSLRCSSWQDKATGTNRRRHYVLGERFEFISSGNRREEGAQEGYGYPEYNPQGEDPPF
mmetsp:Transcript_10967/g.17937  ORF Transcript_10967/g.17937 Transcript_10967/m.17937 type:complete len:271 (-) Transcript_10967:460-1272(-)|eukprot:CAMPEP_0184671976 /NCGR_PEP_ID=MMETSP0308-20130426/85825_1 /TAXON_ID=38269 /ORGANISM="Gloeochaete witrockiana, Strain SAG 46.84" /LENGTH=270 /DNA_ID=CAMNT_0027119213 /DNA_START=20 /DNA_END=832 /DNA_ORIENTATION=+